MDSSRHGGFLATRDGRYVKDCTPNKRAAVGSRGHVFIDNASSMIVPHILRGLLDLQEQHDLSDSEPR
jgi:hypothetical protein